MRPYLTHLPRYLLFVLLASSASANVTLPTVLGNNMVLQRDQPVNIWGWADAGEKITVTLAGKTQDTTAEADGNWRVTFAAQAVNKTGQDVVIKGNNEITLKNVLFGDVWIGSGQSNMQLAIGHAKGGHDAMAQSDNPNLRLYNVPMKKSGRPEKNINADWKVSSPQSLNGLGFSAALYFFGRKVNKDTEIPLGLIHSSWGGSPIEQWQVGSGQMYNAMIAPLHNFNIKGLLWYQGESNVKNGLGYFDKQKKLIDGWRAQWKNEKIPFYFVQLAPWGRYGNGELPATWEGQIKTLTLPNTGMAVTTDIVHNINDIHPNNKIDVGERLALWALYRDYGKTLTYSGPIYKSHKVSGSKIIVSFAHVGKGLAARDGKALTEFKIAGDDGQYVPAVATIEGDTVVVSATSVAAPKNVRFGWHKTANPNFVNKAMLPASPFHTDNWQGGTGEQEVVKATASVARTGSPAAREPIRVFTSTKGVKITARLVKVVDGRVHLVSSRGKKMNVALDALSEADLEYVKSRM